MTNKNQNCNSGLQVWTSQILILSQRLASGKNITEESLCFSSSVGSYGRYSAYSFGRWCPPSPAPPVYSIVGCCLLHCQPLPPSPPSLSRRRSLCHLQATAIAIVVLPSQSHHHWHRRQVAVAPVQSPPPLLSGRQATSSEVPALGATDLADLGARRRVAPHPFLGGTGYPVWYREQQL